jgi:hypothetical protein
MRTTLGARLARRYAAQFAWSIGRGHFVTEDRRVMECSCTHEEALSVATCSCGNANCPTPGCHPVADDWIREASDDPDAITRLWNGQQWWPIALTGSDFDAVVVDGPLPRSALSQLENAAGRLGLVLTWRDEWHAFFVPPGSIADVSIPFQSGISLRGAGGWIPLPAVALLSPARWAVSPKPLRSHVVLNKPKAVLAMLSSLRPSSRLTGPEPR